MTGTPPKSIRSSARLRASATPTRPRPKECEDIDLVRSCSGEPATACRTTETASEFDLGEPGPAPTPVALGTRLFEPGELLSAQKAVNERGSDDLRRRDQGILDALQTSWQKPLMPIPEDYEAILSGWRVTFPNADSVLDLLQECCALAAIDDRVLRMPPIVIEGRPGCGKTFMAEEIGRVFGGGFRRVSMAGMEMGSELGGSDPSWSTTRVGKVLEALVYGGYANPVFLLDEIDKAVGDPRFDPFAALHDLMEPASARRFRDRSFDRVALNAGNIIWIATANDADRIPAAIASRLTRVSVEMPSASQVPAIVSSVMNRLQQDRPGLGRFNLGDDVASALLQESPRSMGQLLTRACARAAQEGTFLVSARHLPAERSVGTRRIGF